ncbi:MAG: SPOR domain-containing protein [Deltaproteobacteria bacterium]|nr:SPOR domain-containing protein [Deltaproteobacteria bacterium]
MGKSRNPSTKTKKSSPNLSRKALIIWISLTFVASAWMFVLGIVVGRGTSPIRFDIEKLQKELALLRETGIMKELRKFKINSGADSHTTEMGFYETLKDTKKETELKVDKREQPSKSLPKDTDSETKKTVISEKNKTEKVPKKSKAVSVHSKISEKPPLTIQIASLKDPKKADRMVAELKKKGFPAYRSMGKIPGRGIWYRVRIGYYKNKSEAGRMLSKLNKDKDNVKAIIVER